jgi:hypothetical protein
MVHVLFGTPPEGNGEKPIILAKNVHNAIIPLTGAWNTDR